MAKGDSAQASTMVNNAQTRNNQLYNSMYNNYGAGVSRDLPTYDSLMGNYNTFLGGGRVGGSPRSSVGGYSGNAADDIRNAEAKLGWTGNFNQYRGKTDQLAAALGPGWKGGGSTADDWLQDPNGQGYDVISTSGQPLFMQDNTGQGGGQGQGFQAIPGWQEFAQTGGFSPQDIQDIRARSVAPIRAGYQYAADEMARNRALSGGYSPNFNAASAKMARDQAYATSDAMTNADAAIAQLKQQGRLYGLSGLTNAQLGAMNAMTSLYGTRPGLSSTFGQQALESGGQGIDLIRALVAKSQVPGAFDVAAGRASTAGNILKGLFGGSGGGSNGGVVNDVMNAYRGYRNRVPSQGDVGSVTNQPADPYYSAPIGDVQSNWHVSDPNFTGQPDYTSYGDDPYYNYGYDPSYDANYQTEYLGGSGNYPGQQGYQSAYYDPFMNYGEDYSAGYYGGYDNSDWG